MTAKLQIAQLSKTYANGVRALDDISLDIPTGMFGLLGPNGAGKSTLMRTLATLQEPDQGSIRLGELDILAEKRRLRQRLGYLPQDFGVYGNVDPLTMLDHLAVLKGLADRKARKTTVETLLRRVNLWDYRKRKMGGFSGGMKQRFGIAQALLGQPELIIVDEPTAGLDPEERNRFLNLLSAIGESVVVILSTHIVDDVDDLCPRMAILAQGRLTFTGRPHDAIARLDGKVWRKTVAREDLDAHREQHKVLFDRLVAGQTVIHILADGAPDADYSPVQPGLEDVYFAEINHGGLPA